MTHDGSHYPLSKGTDVLYFRTSYMFDLPALTNTGLDLNIIYTPEENVLYGHSIVHFVSFID